MAKRKLELKAGCWVRLRRGWVVGPMEHDPKNSIYPWYMCGVGDWLETGRYLVTCLSEYDIMAVVPKPRREA